jgi:hypothetical protein
LRPARSCRWQDGDTGVELLVPRFGEGIIGRTIDRLFHPTPYKARLDDLGTFVWRRCDGATTVEQIADALRQEFGEKVEPVEDRLVGFITKLSKGRFVSVV